MPAFLHIWRLMSARNNINSIEMLRGIAAMMVTYFHMARGNTDFLQHDSLVYKAGEYGWAGVEVFFVISGFIITYAMCHGGYKLARVHKFLAKRLIRLEPPYIVSIILVIGLMYLSAVMPDYRGKPVEIDWGNVLGHLGYINAFTGERWLQDVYWTLAVEFEFYLGLALLFPLITHKNRALSLVSMILLLLLAFTSANPMHVLYYLPLFCMGIILSLFRAGKYSSLEFWALITITVVVSYIRLGVFFTCIGISTISIIHFVKAVPQPLVWLGKGSYSLYLLHIPIGGRLINLFEVKVKSQDARSILVFVVIAICLLCSWGFYKIVERPFQKISKKIAY